MLPASAALLALAAVLTALAVWEESMGRTPTPAPASRGVPAAG